MRASILAAALLTVAFAAIPAANMAARAHAQVLVPPNPNGPDNPSGDQSAPSDQQVPQAGGTLNVQSNLVQVFTSVRDSHNGMVINLTKDDFKVFEDGKEQPITYFGKESDMPITLAMLMDTSGSMYYIMDAEKEAASDFVHEIMRKKDEAVVISFDTDADLLADWTEDPTELTRAIRRAEVKVNSAGIGGTAPTVSSNGGGTNLFDAIYLACHDKLQSEAGRKAIIVLSDAEDNGSKMSINEAIEMAQRSDAVIHVILISDPGATEGYGTGIALQLAGKTGGRVVAVHNDKTMAKAFDEISEELRQQYVLGYRPLNAARDGTYRKIRVEVKESGYKVRAREGYYAPNH
jgi:VWFA-related protein